MKSEHLFLLGLVGITMVTALALHCADEENQVKVGLPFFKAEIN
ncbi:MAG: hypothetical protein WED10_09165 [Brumimicrobium sp.]